MFLPLGDTPRPPGYVPLVNWAFIAINIGIYLFISVPLSSQPVDPSDPVLRQYLVAIGHGFPQGVPVEALRNLSAYDLYVFAHGYKPAAPELSDLLYSLFLHGGLLHLAGNMLFLWIFGTNVEHRLGPLGYGIAYLGTGVVATLTYAAFARHSPMPLVGASGAISGVLGLYFLCFPHNRVKVFIFLFPIFFDVVLLPARIVLGIFLLLDNLLPLALGGQSSVAYGAHIGGFLAGLAVGGVGELVGWRLPWRGHTLPDMGEHQALEGGGDDGVVEDAPSWHGLQTASSPGDTLREAIRRGDRRLALAQVSSVGAAELYRMDLTDLAGLAEWLAEAGYEEEAHALLHRALAQHRRVEAPELARVYLALGLIQLRLGQTPAAYQLFRRVLALDADPETAARAHDAIGSIPMYRRNRPS